MPSNIDNTSIDATFPVAGQDNDSQGFRNNFNTIKNNFTAAKNEIEDLQTNTAKLNTSNNFLGNDLTGANLIGNSEKHYAGGTVVAPQDISFTNGNFQTFTIGGNITLTLKDWPAITLEDDQIHLIQNGQPIWMKGTPINECVRIYDANEKFYGIGALLDDGRIAPKSLG